MLLPWKKFFSSIILDDSAIVLQSAHFTWKHAGTTSSNGHTENDILLCDDTTDTTPNTQQLEDICLNVKKVSDVWLVSFKIQVS